MVDDGKRKRRKRAKRVIQSADTVCKESVSEIVPIVNEVPQIQPVLPKITKQGQLKSPGRRWYLVGLAFVCLAAIVPLGNAYNSSRGNMLIGFGLMAIFAGAGILLWLGLKKPEHTIIIEHDKVTWKPETVNCFNIYRDHLAFEHSDHPVGQPRLCRTFNSNFFVQVVASDPVPLVLPDKWEYFPPGEFANVLMQPGHTKLRRRKATLLEQIAPGILLLANIAMGVVLISVAT